MNFNSTLLSDFASISTIVAATIAVIALLYTAYQVRLSAKISTGTFWLELEKMFSQHDEIHLKLRPSGEWANSQNGPNTTEDWAKLEDYMGLFEHCEIMLQKKLIDWNTFKAIFSYRIYNIISNQKIVEAKLIQEKDSWGNFLKLLKRMKVNI